MTINTIKRKITPILKRQGVVKAAVFGSFARESQTGESDIDLLVKIEENRTLFDLINLKLDLEDRLGRKVDIVEYEALNPFIKKEVLKEQKKIYEKKS